MAFQVSARKYRPGTFAEVVAQPFVVQTLRQALLQKRLAHAYLFFGPRGVGKTTCARILAKAANCENLTSEGDPCLTCASCQRFQESRALNLLELDAASHNSVEDIRAIIDQVHLAPPQGRYMVYIIDEVHMLSTAAFNAFLKTLEEPPPHAIFILATTEKHKVPATILSRCQRFDFRRLPTETITQHLARIAQREGIEAEPEALFLIASKSEGGLRDALSLFDQLVSRLSHLSYSAVLQVLEVLDYEAYFSFSEALRQFRLAEAVELFRRHLLNGYDPGTLLQGLIEHFRHLLLAQEAPQALSETLPPHYRQRYENEASAYGRAFLLHGLDILLEAERRLTFTRLPEVAVEIALAKVGLLYQALQAPAGPSVTPLPTPTEAVPIADTAKPSSLPSAAPSAPEGSKATQSLFEVPQSLQDIKKKS
jgi:DNA polymerase-3 subunit gamma/tau